MPARGRPLKTEIREKIALLLLNMGHSYGYEIHKWYQDLFGEVTLRNLYYNLKKGLELGEFLVLDIRREMGSYTWGGESQHVYYALGPYAKTHPTQEFTSRQNEQLQILPKRNTEINWEKEVNNKIKQLEVEIEKLFLRQQNMFYEQKIVIKNKIKNNAEMLKEWMKNRFDKQKAHELRTKIDETILKLGE